MKYFFLLISLLLLKSCSSQNEQVKTTSIKKMQITNAYFKAAFSKDYTSLYKLLDDGVLFFGPQKKDTLNKEELIDSWHRTHAHNDIMEYNNPKIYAAVFAIGDEKPTEWIFHYYDAHFHNSDLDVWLDFPVHVKFRFKEDKIDRMYISINQAEIQKQLGYKIIPPTLN